MGRIDNIAGCCGFVAALLAAGLSVLSATGSAQAQSWRSEPLDAGRLPEAVVVDARPSARARDPDALPDGRVAEAGAGDIRAAWYARPTTRYAHAVLGDAIEAGALRVATAAGAVAERALPEDEVFEDITPRLADLDGDGRTEIVTLLASRSGGAAVALFGLENGRLVERARTPHVGRRNRWRNVAGVADFAAGGGLEIAEVQTPHIGGILRLWRFENGRLVQLDAADDFSNHVIGDRELRLSAVADVDGDGLADLALPSARRDRLRVMSAPAGRWRSLADVPLSGRVQSAIAHDDGRFVLRVVGGGLRAVSR